MFEEKLQSKIKRLGQQQVAELVGCSQPTISRILNKKNPPSLKVVAGLMALTGCTFDEVLKGVSHKDPSSLDDFFG